MNKNNICINDYFNGSSYVGDTKCCCCGQDGEKGEEILDGCENKGKCNSYNPGFEYYPGIEYDEKDFGEDFVMKRL